MARSSGEESDELASAMEDLVEHHFTHWSRGRPPDARDEKLREVHTWLAAQVSPYKAVATALIARIEPLLGALKLALPPDEKSRFLYRVDGGHIVKSPASILEKMAREWCQAGGRTPSIGFDDLRSVKDLGRFRIVANFLSDAEEIRRKLEAPYDARRRPHLSEDELRLQQEFMLVGNAFEDLIALRPAQRKSGERCFKAHFAPRSGAFSVCSVEVQIVTAFQEAWDKKDHFLIYERRRMGHPVPEADLRVSFALSEQLYLADLFFDQLKRGVAPRPVPSSPSE